MDDGVGGARTVFVSAAFVFSGFTSFVALIAAKRFLTADDFGVFSIFWSLGFFAAAVNSAPVEQELARSVAVQLERGRLPDREIAAALRALGVGSVLVLSVSAAAILFGLISANVGLGMFVALSVLVVGEAVAALVRGEASARRDVPALVVEVAGHGLVRGAAAAIAAVLTQNLVVVCLGVALGGIVPVCMTPRLLRRRRIVGRQPALHDTAVDAAPHEFSYHGVRRLVLGTPPRALFAIGTPVLAAVVAGRDQTAAIGDVLAALSITSAPVLIAVALQATMIPQFAGWEERGEHKRSRARLVLILWSVVLGTVVSTAFAGVAGRPLLQTVFGETPGVGNAALAMMTAGAGMLFLANLLSPPSIAIRQYTAMTVAWTSGALALVFAAFGPGAIADSIGRAVLIGALVVNVVLLWGLRSVIDPMRRTDRDSSNDQHAGSGA
jgi:O-antigen/teichoic acid export membrane protein